MPKWLRTALLILCILIFLFSAYKLVSYYVDSQKRQSQFGELSKLVNDIRSKENPEDPDTGKPALVPVKNPLTGEIIPALPEYAPLYEKNCDFVGWIRLDGTVIDYPVVQKSDKKEYYLRRDFEGNKSTHGTIYVKESCDVFTPSDNVTLYGHKMRDGSMFAALLGYKDPAFYQEHQTVFFDTLSEYHTYQVFAMFPLDATTQDAVDINGFTDSLNELEFIQFVSRCKELSLYDTGITPEYGDHLLTLVTCDVGAKTGRFFVVAKRID